MTTSEIIIQATEATKIKDLNDAKIILLIEKLLKMVSVQRKPDDDSIKILIAGIKRNYSGYSAQEFIVAFELFIDDRLELKNHEHFQSFDFIYLRKIMNAYKDKFRGKAIIEKNNSKQLKLDAPAPKTIEEQEEEHFLWLTSHFTEKKVFPVGVNYRLAYDYAQKSGLFKLSSIEKQKIRDNTIKKIKSDLKASKQAGAKIKISMLETIIKSDTAIRIECKTYFIKNFVKENY